MTQAANRAAAVTMLTECAANASVSLQVYPARPRGILPPTAFIDGLHDDLTDFAGSTIFQHRPLVDIVCLWGLFDSAEAAAQRDAFVDAFHLWVAAHYHAAGGASLIKVTRVDDLPAYVPDWLPPEAQLTYYGTSIGLEGFNTD